MPRQKSKVVVEIAGTEPGTWLDVDTKCESITGAEQWVRREGKPGATYRIALARQPVTVAVEKKEVRKLTPVA